MSKSIVPADYAEFLTGLKERIRSAQITAARAVNRELILLYWDIGHAIVEKQQLARWGDAVVERLASDLRAEFPDMRGFSANSLWLMRQFYSEYASQEFLEQLVQELDNMGDAEFLEQSVRELASTGGTGFLVQPVPEIEFLRQIVADIPNQNAAARRQSRQMNPESGPWIVWWPDSSPAVLDVCLQLLVRVRILRSPAA